jgi:uncharacterized protein YjbI with pentapeptide repeats
MFQEPEEIQPVITAESVPEEQGSSETGKPSTGCPVEMHFGARCGRSVHPAPNYDQVEVCLMHSNDPHKSESDFQEEIKSILESKEYGVADFTRFVFRTTDFMGQEFKAPVVFEHATFLEHAFFLNAVFLRDANFEQAHFFSSVNFREAEFKQEANFRHAKFQNSADFHKGKFSGSASFYEANFADETLFLGTMFEDSVYFRKATFTKLVNFVGAKFKLGAFFSEATFKQKSNFTVAKFLESADFSGVTFEQEAQFNNARFTDNAYFYQTTFVQDAEFTAVIFTQNVYFSKAKFEQKADFRGAKFCGPVDFRETEFNRDEKLIPGPIFSLAEFSKPELVVFYNTYLGRALFQNCDVSKMTFWTVEWRKRKNNKKWMLFEEVVDLASAEDLRPKKDVSLDRDFRSIAEVYQQLKKNFDDRKDYWTAGDFHYGEMEMKRLSSRAKWSKARWLIRHFRLVAWYRYASEYGESYMRPGLWLLVVLLTFGLLFPVSGLRYDPAKDRDGNATNLQAVVLTYKSPLFPGQPASERHRAQWRLGGNSLLSSLQIAAFQKELAYQPVNSKGRTLVLLEMLLTSILGALFFLAINRQFRR